MADQCRKQHKNGYQVVVASANLQRTILTFCFSQDLENFTLKLWDRRAISNTELYSGKPIVFIITLFRRGFHSPTQFLSLRPCYSPACCSKRPITTFVRLVGISDKNRCPTVRWSCRVEDVWHRMVRLWRRKSRTSHWLPLHLHSTLAWHSPSSWSLGLRQLQ